VGSENFFNILSIKVQIRGEASKREITVTDIDILVSQPDIRLIVDRDPAPDFIVGDFVTLFGSPINGQYKTSVVHTSTGPLDPNYVEVVLGSNSSTFHGALNEIKKTPVNELILTSDRTSIVANNKAAVPTFGGLLELIISGTNVHDGPFFVITPSFDPIRNRTTFSSVTTVPSPDLDDLAIDITPYRETLPGVVDEAEIDDGEGHGIFWLTNNGAGTIVIESLKEIIDGTGSILVPSFSSTLFSVFSVELYDGIGRLRVRVEGPLPSASGPGLAADCDYFFMKSFSSIVASMRHTGTIPSDLLLNYFNGISGNMERLPAVTSFEDGTGGFTRNGVISATLGFLSWVKGIPPELIEKLIVDAVDVDNGGIPPRGEITVNKDLTAVLPPGTKFHLFDSPSPALVEGDYTVFSITPTLITTTTPITGSDVSGTPFDLAIVQNGFYLSIERRSSILYEPPILRNIALANSTRVNEDTDGSVTGKRGNKYVITDRFPAVLRGVLSTGPVNLESARIVPDTSVIDLNTDMPISFLGLVTVEYQTRNIPYIIAKVFTDKDKIFKMDAFGSPDAGAVYESGAYRLRGYVFFVDNLGPTVIPVSVIANIGGRAQITIRENFPDSIKPGDKVFFRLTPDPDVKSGKYLISEIEGKTIFLTTPMPGGNLSNPNAEVQISLYDRLNNKQREEWRSVLADILESIASVHAIGDLFFEEPSPNEPQDDFPTRGERNETFKRALYRFFRRI